MASACVTKVANQLLNVGFERPKASLFGAFWKTAGTFFALYNVQERFRFEIMQVLLFHIQTHKLMIN